MPSAPPAGRPRDQHIDACVLDAALSELGDKGYRGFSLAAVAEAAGTTRPAIYRRWKDKSALIVDAVARLADTAPPVPSGDPHAGLMLAEAVDPAVREAYLEQIVGPRRARLRAILKAGVELGELDAAADLEVAGSFLTGSWYSLAVAGIPLPAQWPQRVADLVWVACSQPRRGR